MEPDFVTVALSGRPVWDLGQIDASTRRELNQLARNGRLAKARAHWMHISPLKTVWYTPGAEPQEVLAAHYAAQRAPTPSHSVNRDT